MTTDLASRFADAQARSKELKKTPDTDDLLALYALFKQGSVGDATGARPGMMDFKGRAKFDAWTGKKGLSTDAAQEAYVALVDKLAKGLTAGGDAAIDRPGWSPARPIVEAKGYRHCTTMSIGLPTGEPGPKTSWLLPPRSLANLRCTASDTSAPLALTAHALAHAASASWSSSAA